LIYAAKPMVEMTPSISISRPGSEFDDFLYAPIAEERNGMRLSVLSALARLDVDPWQEAATLARLPVATATERLASLITTLPREPSRHPDTRAIAARLIALLPRRSRLNIPSRATPLDTTATSTSRAVLYAALLILALGANYIIASRLLPKQEDGAPSPVSQQISPRSSD
jgi:hypothetical protein